MRARIATLAGLAGLLLAAAGAPVAGAAAADQPLAVVGVDVSAAPQVRVVVATPPALAAQTLAASAFSVRDGDRTPQVSVEALPADQLDVALVIDTSGSMAGAPLAAAKAAARTLLAQLPPTVPAAVVGFGATPVLASARSTDRTAQAASVDALQARGETALYDAVQMGVRQLSAGSDTARRSLVLLSDGRDTGSRASLEATVSALAGAHVTVFAVELTTGESDAEALGRLASATGGQAVAVADPAALAGLFDGVAKQLVRQYALTWSSASRGPVDAAITLDAAGVRSTVKAHLALPGAAAPAPAAKAPKAPKPAAPSSSSAPAGRWMLIVGCGLVCLAVLLVLVPTALLRTPRSRALVDGRWMSAERLAGRAEGLADRLLRRGDQGSTLNAALERAGVDLRAGELVVAVVCLAGALGFGVGVAVSLLAGLIAGLAVVVAVRIGLAGLDWRRRQQFADQLGGTLQMLASSLRAGYGLSQAIDVVAREAESPTAEEFRRIMLEARLGRDMAEALGAAAQRVRSQDFAWVVEAFDIHREVGGDLAEVLDTVAGTIRDRNRVRRQVRALSAEGRMSALVLFVLPFILAVVTAVLDPGYLHELTASRAGVGMIVGGGVLMGAGGLWLRRIVKPQF